MAKKAKIIFAAMLCMGTVLAFIYPAVGGFFMVFGFFGFVVGRFME